MNIKEKLNISDDQLYKLHLMYHAGFATKKMMEGLSLKATISHLEMLADAGADYEKIKTILIKDIQGAP